MDIVATSSAVMAMLLGHRHGLVGVRRLQRPLSLVAICPVRAYSSSLPTTGLLWINPRILAGA